MTENEATREMTFEEEYQILQKEKEELFAMENCDSETPFANCVVRRSLRCIRKLLEELQQYRELERNLKEKYQADVDIKMLIQHFIDTIFKGEKHEGFCILTNEEAAMWKEYRAIELTPKMVKEMIESEKLASRQAIIRGVKLEQYEAIGTIEEFKALKEKSVAKKPIDKEIYLECPACGNLVTEDSYCQCGQYVK